ncbi:uncharacterized protein [Desmodus rotundus]|uniref:uncharacterized protein n=1 Tax=Desmodus rotundus TaxID=9430 RepID=UPI002380DB63|nr:5E5 antigen-like [Desmodus rotundus]
MRSVLPGSGLELRSGGSGGGGGALGGRGRGAGGAERCEPGADSQRAGSGLRLGVRSRGFLAWVRLYKVTREGPRRSIKRRQGPARPQSGAPSPAVLPSPIPSVAIATPILLLDTGSHRRGDWGGKEGRGGGGGGGGGGGRRRGTDRERSARLELSRAPDSAAAATATTAALQNSLRRPASEEGPRAARTNSGSPGQSPRTATRGRQKQRPDPHTSLRVLTGTARVLFAPAPPPPGKAQSRFVPEQKMFHAGQCNVVGFQWIGDVPLIAERNLLYSATDSNAKLFQKHPHTLRNDVLPALLVSLLARPVEAFTKEGCCGHLLLAVAVWEIWSLHPLRTQPESSNMKFCKVLDNTGISPESKHFRFTVLTKMALEDISED